MQIIEAVLKQKKLFSLFFLLWLSLFFYAIWSYSQTDVNLVLINFAPYWHFQTWLWQVTATHRQLMSWLYVILIAALFIIYWQLVTFLSLKKWSLVVSKTKIKTVLVIWLVVVSPLFFSYNALSHDVFNYIFNAKMVVKYHANPHVQVALDFKEDLWVRFMHNTHTPAPYFYGWTGLSILPYLLGAGKFLLTWLAFRFFAVLSLGLLFWAILRLLKQLSWPMEIHHLALLFFNPLLLIEVISNAHNDAWMMGLVLLSLSLLQARLNKKWLIVSLLLFALSASIKYATFVLLPIWLWFLLLSLLDQLLVSRLVFVRSLIAKALTLTVGPTFLIASVLMFGLLLFDRSRQFLPWYLIWSLVWLPLILTDGKNSLAKFLLNLPLFGKFSAVWSLWLLAFSFSALLRYVPWLLQGEYLVQTNTQEKLLTWLGGSLFFGLGLLCKKLFKRRFLLQ